MPYLPTAAEWLTQSSLLLQARPTTTKITTRYAHPKPKVSKKKSESVPAPPVDPSAPPKPPKPASLVLKTYDPVSGTCLKYQTNKAAEVGRLVASLGKLGRVMAGLPGATEDIAMGDAPPAAGKEGETGTNTPLPGAEGGKGNPLVVAAAEVKGKEAARGGKKKKGKGKK